MIKCACICRKGRSVVTASRGAECGSFPSQDSHFYRPRSAELRIRAIGDLIDNQSLGEGAQEISAR
jgi:hypothetical protein